MIAKVNGEKARIMLDTGAGSSYICTNFLTKLKLKPTRKEHKSIEQLYGTMDKCVEIYHITLESITVLEFRIEVECINAEKVNTHLRTQPDDQGCKEAICKNKETEI